MSCLWPFNTTIGIDIIMKMSKACIYMIMTMQCQQVCLWQLMAELYIDSDAVFDGSL